MSNLAKISMLAFAVVTTTAATPFAPAGQSAMTVVPLAIIEGGTVSTVPKGVKARRRKVVVLRARTPRAPVRSARTAAPAAKNAARPASTARTGERETTRAAVSAGGSSDPVDFRGADNALRVMMIGPDGLTRTRFVPAAPGITARPMQDD